MNESKFNSVVSLAKKRGFVYQSAEIYGGMRSAWDYGPLGVLFKENIKKAWWDFFVRKRSDMVGLDSAIILPFMVWKASGHVDTFCDLLVESLHTHKRYRVDTLLDEYAHKHGKYPQNGIADVPDPETGQQGNWTTPKQFSGLMKTQVGPAAEQNDCYFLRPETAQGIFLNFKNILRTTRKKPPFGVAQVGKAFRNEITPGNFIFRTREFEQFEIEYFVQEASVEHYFNMWVDLCLNWYISLGIDRENIKIVDVPEDKRAHYSKRTVDFEYRFGFDGGEWGELMGIAHRGTFDLKNHSDASGIDLTYVDQSSKYLPDIIEPSFGLARSMMALLLDAYEEEEVIGGDGEAKNRTVLRLNKDLAPVSIAVLPLSKNDLLVPKALELADFLRQNTQYNIDYDESGAIGKRYRRNDEIGTPFCVTVDFDTESDLCVTIRERDSMKQERIPLSNILDYFTNAFRDK